MSGDDPMPLVDAIRLVAEAIDDHMPNLDSQDDAETIRAFKVFSAFAYKFCTAGAPPVTPESSGSPISQMYRLMYFASKQAKNEHPQARQRIKEAIITVTKLAETAEKTDQKALALATLIENGVYPAALMASDEIQTYFKGQGLPSDPEFILGAYSKFDASLKGGMYKGVRWRIFEGMVTAAKKGLEA